MRLIAEVLGLLCRKELAVLTVMLALSATSLQAQVQIDTRQRTRGTSDLSDLRTRANTSSLSNNRYNQQSDTTLADTSATKGLEEHEDIPDSVLRMKVFFFNYTPRTLKINEVWNPSLDPTGVQYSNTLDGFNGNYYLGKGVIGHPHLGLYRDLGDGLGVTLQADEMAGYAKTPGNMRMYQTFTPYTVLSYNNTLRKEYLVNVLHTQNIIPGWNIALDYRLICPESVFSNSAAKDHFLDATTNYYSSDSRLQLKGGFIWQSFDIGENGGLSDDSVFTSGSMSNQGGFPVVNSNAIAKHMRRTAFMHASYNLVRQFERYRTRDSLAASYDTVSADSVVLVMDTIEVVDTIRIHHPHVFNAGVFGLEAEYNYRRRAAYMSSYADSTIWAQTSATLFWTNDAYPDHRWHNPVKVTLGASIQKLEATLRADTVSAYEEIKSSTALNPFAKAELHLWKITLKGGIEMDNTLLALNSAIKDPDCRGTMAALLTFDSTRRSGVEVSATMQQKMPDVRLLYLSNYTLGSIGSMRYGLHLFHSSDSSLLRLVDIDVRTTCLSHNVWFDTALTLHTGTHELWLSQAAFTMRLQWGWCHLDMQQLLQHCSDQGQLRVPLWTSKNSLYADFYLFHSALRMQIGTDVRCYTRFAPDGYDPATGFFYKQDEETGNYLWADAFINLQIKRASIYLKAGHFNAVWERSPNYFLLPHYPGQKFSLQWGMTWNFFD